MSGPDEIFENEMDQKAFASLEQSLAKTLAPMEAPAGFVDRVMARAHAGEAAKRTGGGRLLVMPMRQWRAWAAGAVAAVLVLGALEGSRVHQQQERRVEAQRQFETAERITDQTLQHTREQLRQQGILLDQ
jgi:hypothetical protein